MYIYIYIYKWVGPHFAFRTALILCDIDSTRCWKHSSEILVHIAILASHSFCGFLGCTSMMWISRSTTSQRFSIGFRYGDCGGHLSKVNSLSCSRNQSEMIWAFSATWTHKNSYLCALFSETIFTYLTAHFAAVSERNVHWVVLKHRFNMWTLAHFYYVHIGMYCSVFIKLLQECIAAVQNSNIRDRC